MILFPIKRDKHNIWTKAAPDKSLERSGKKSEKIVTIANTTDLHSDKQSLIHTVMETTHISVIMMHFVTVHEIRAMFLFKF